MKNLGRQPWTRGSNKIINKNSIIRPTLGQNYKPSDSSSSGIVSARTQSALPPPGQAVTHTLEQGGVADYPIAAAADTGAEVDQSTGLKNEASAVTELNFVTQPEKGEEGSEPPVTAMAIEFLPLSTIFPPLTPEEQDDLTEDIRKNGLIEPIILYEEKILDGRARYLACLTADVSPQFKTYDGNDPVGYLVSRNVLRRHLTDTQRAMIGAQIANLEIGANQHSEGMSIDTASKVLAVSVTSINRCKKVFQNGSTELIEVTRPGKLSLSKAVKISGLPKSEQVEYLARSPAEGKRRKAKQHQRSEQNEQTTSSPGGAAAGDIFEEGPDRESIEQETRSSITSEASNSSEADTYPDLPPDLDRRLPSGYGQICAELKAAWQKGPQAVYDAAPLAVQRWFVTEVLGAAWMAKS